MPATKKPRLSHCCKMRLLEMFGQIQRREKTSVSPEDLLFLVRILNENSLDKEERATALYLTTRTPKGIKKFEMHVEHFRKSPAVQKFLADLKESEEIALIDLRRHRPVW